MEKANRSIDSQIEKDRARMRQVGAQASSGSRALTKSVGCRSEVKMLLLGTGE